jgi:hypothetical protein
VLRLGALSHIPLFDLDWGWDMLFNDHISLCKNEISIHMFRGIVFS